MTRRQVLMLDLPSDLRFWGAGAGTRTRNLAITNRLRYRLRHASQSLRLPRHPSHRGSSHAIQRWCPQCRAQQESSRTRRWFQVAVGGLFTWFRSGDGEGVRAIRIGRRLADAGSGRNIRVRDADVWSGRVHSGRGLLLGSSALGSVPTVIRRGWWWQPADHQPVGSGLVATHQRWGDPADLVVPVVARPNPDPAEVAAAQVRDRRVPTRVPARLPRVWDLVPMGCSAGQIEDVDADSVPTRLSAGEHAPPDGLVPLLAGGVVGQWERGGRGLPGTPGDRGRDVGHKRGEVGGAAPAADDAADAVQVGRWGRAGSGLAATIHSRSSRSRPRSSASSTIPDTYPPRSMTW
jgi:hypothetical protein